MFSNITKYLDVSKYLSRICPKSTEVQIANVRHDMASAAVK